MKIRVTHSPDSPNILTDAASVMEMCAHPESFEGTKVIHDGRNRVVLYTDKANGRKYVIKSFKQPNTAQRIAYTWFTPSKAKRAYNYATELRARGIDTPKETAYIETYMHGLLSHCYFICEYIPWPSLASLWLPNLPFTDAQIGLLAGTLVKMHEAGVLHGDTNIGNFLYDAETNKLTTVDVNRTKFLEREPSHKECLDNMVRLTHRTDVLGKTGEQYARLRGWNEKEVTEYLLESLHEFEQKRNRRQKMKKLFLHR